MTEVDNRRPPADVAAEAEELAQFLYDFTAFDLEETGGESGPSTNRALLKRAAAFIREAYTEQPAGREYFVGVKDGKECVTSNGDSAGDAKTVELYTTPEAACARFHNVRRARLIVDTTPVRPPESWGAIDGE